MYDVYKYTWDALALWRVPATYFVAVFVHVDFSTLWSGGGVQSQGLAVAMVTILSVSVAVLVQGQHLVEKQLDGWYGERIPSKSACLSRLLLQVNITITEA